MSSSPRPTLRTLAAEAGVSPMTVSLALRNHHSISAAVRTRLQRLAASRDYRPDPTITKLMHHLRTKRPKRVQAVICALTDHKRRKNVPPYWMGILHAARQRAESLGYAFEQIDLDGYGERPDQLSRTLHNRGIEGIVLLPMTQAENLEKLLDWREFSAVATSYSVAAPQFHRVVPYMFSNLFFACQQLVARGYRRLGLAVSTTMEQRTFHHFTSALAWQREHGGGCTVPTLIADELSLARVSDWLDREQPDVVIGSAGSGVFEKICQTGRRVPQDIGVIYHSRLDAQIAAIDEKPDVIGTTAVDILTGLVQRGEKGTPATAKVTMIEGGWHEGRTLRPLRATRRR